LARCGLERKLAGPRSRLFLRADLRYSGRAGGRQSVEAPRFSMSDPEKPNAAATPAPPLSSSAVAPRPSLAPPRPGGPALEPQVPRQTWPGLSPPPPATHTNAVVIESGGKPYTGPMPPPLPVSGTGAPPLPPNPNARNTQPLGLERVVEPQPLLPRSGGPPPPPIRSRPPELHAPRCPATCHRRPESAQARSRRAPCRR
jgi:hypothetical protein